MHLFYYPHVTEKEFALDKNESAHCIRVLRLGKGDFIYLTDGQGYLYKSQIINPAKNACIIRIIKKEFVPKPRDYTIQIAIAPTKSNDRFEWFLEKSTEIGIDRIIPLLCKNSERKKINRERFDKIIVSAVKQSLTTWVPEITELTPIKDLISRNFDGEKFIATGEEPPELNLGKLYHRGNNVLILIGPEGDFQSEELEYAKATDFLPVNLGPGRLRTETAGIVACQTINFINSPR